MIDIAVITTSRADYGILRPLIKALVEDPDINAGLLVSGGHLDERQGSTVREIEQDGFPIRARIPLGAAKDTAHSVTQQMARCIDGFAAQFTVSRPDLLIALGDRYEMFAAVSASVPFNIPVAHIHGGELTYGAQDDNFRHALTKLSHLHFASTAEYATRIKRMGEPPERVFNVGALSIDGIKSAPRLSKAELFARFDIRWNSAPLLVTLHAETKAALPVDNFAQAFFDALKDVDRTIIITHPNVDAGGATILKAAQAFQAQRSNVFIVPNFGAQAYYSLLTHAAAMVGNSSSGITEAAAFDLPVVNVGNRQKGRVRSANIIDVAMETDQVASATARALSSEFRAQLQGMDHAYGDGTAAHQILSIIKSVGALQDLIIKEFHDFNP